METKSSPVPIYAGERLYLDDVQTQRAYDDYQPIKKLNGFHAETSSGYLNHDSLQ